MKVCLCRIGLVIGIIAAFFIVAGDDQAAFRAPVDLLYAEETDS